ncbi:MAG: hypothetical protein IJL19_07165 [Clostridiales bacterium]|nr:hypothetical protein [Clostridiales bacterium]
MKRIIRKVTSIFIATAIVAAMGLASLAAENIPGNGNVIGSKNPADPVEKTLVIEKELTVYNPDTTEVYAPNVTYNYAIAGIDANKLVTDSDGVSARTKEGPSGATITSEIKWENTEKVQANSTGFSNTKNLTIDLSSVTFTGAGVYRYQITETCSDKAANGVTEGTIAEVRYLDVYVRDPRTGETGYQIYGYVLFENNNDIDGTDNASVEAAVKTEGFVKTDSLTADSYYTYNVSVTKTLVNDQANESHAFPFAFTFTKASGVTGDFNLIASYAATSATAMDATVSTTIAHNNTVTYTGIPCGTTVNIVETNDVATATYKVTTTGADANIAADDDVLLNFNESTDAAAVEINSNAVDAAGTDFDVTFTNTFELISPTGVAMAVLPFVILLAFGIGFMVVSTKKRKEEQA